MAAKPKICVVTGSRADYGLLEPILRLLSSGDVFELQIVVTGMHLSSEFGNTFSIIEQDGYEITAKVDSLVSGDSSVAIAKSIGLGTMGFADAFERLNPDWLLILGDRFEIFAAAQVALTSNIPIAHIAGGDSTEGAFDEAIRHSITKMSHVHFVTNEMSAKRIRQMGENPQHIHVVGSPGLDCLRGIKFLTRNDLENTLGMRFREHNLLITYHPSTLSPNESMRELQVLLASFESLGSDFSIFMTRSNADTHGRKMNTILENWVSTRENAGVYTSLGQQIYLSLMKEVNAVVGNSSSGLYEAPSLKTPTVNIGNRQKGRLMASSVINCGCDITEICRSILRAIEMDVSEVKNPYGDGFSAPRIVELLTSIRDPKSLIMKKFHLYDGHES